MCKRVTYKTSRNYRFGVRHYHVRFGHSVGGFTNAFYVVVCQGLRRQSRSPAKVGPRLPITFPFLLDMTKALDLSICVELLDAALFAFGFWTGRRPSNWVVRYVEGELVFPVLTWADVSFDARTENSMAVVSFQGSKTDIDHVGGTSRVFANPTRACPVKTLRALKIAADRRGHGRATDPVFVVDEAPASCSCLQRRLRMAVERAQANVGAYSAYSLRRGFATTMHMLGATGPLIQACGAWRSAAYRRYVEKSDNFLRGWMQRVADTAALSYFGILSEGGALHLSMANVAERPAMKGSGWI